MSSIDAYLYYGALEDFRSLLNGPAPTLKAVRIRGEGYLGHAQSLPLYSPSFQDRFPALRTLWLEGYPSDLARSVPVMANGLTKLVLYKRQSHHLRDLLDYMEHCANLEHLKIELPGLHGTAPASRVVSLPKSRELEFVRSTPAVFYHLSFPPSSDLTIQLGVMSYAQAEEYPLVDLWASPHI